MANNINCTCGHSWSKASSSKKDMYVCHMCGKDNTMKDGGWLDNYGKKPNPNDVEVSTGPGYVGSGYDVQGRDYSPAWGGQFQMGGSILGKTFLQPNNPKLPVGWNPIEKGYSTEYSTTVGKDGEYYLVPGFKHGKLVSDPEKEFYGTGELLGGPFKTIQSAQDFADRRHKYVEQGKPIPSPIKTYDYLKFAMGGSMPGAVGFTYARTAGSAPSNGKYAKKTKASAQNGKEMKFYQEGLDFKPNSIAQDGGAIVDPMGQWAHPGEVTIIPSTDITMEGVDYPVLGISDTGDQQMMYPGEDYQFDGDYVTEYPMMKEGGWLSKYQDGGGLLMDRFKEEKAPSDATRVSAPIKPLTKKEQKENVRINKQTQKNTEEYNKAVIADRKSKRETKGDVNVPGSFNISEKLKLSNILPESWTSPGGAVDVFDEYLNPGAVIGPLADSLGESIAARSPEGVATTLAMTLGAGALGFDPLGSSIKSAKKIGKHLTEKIASKRFSKFSGVDDLGMFTQKGGNKYYQLGEPKNLETNNVKINNKLKDWIEQQVEQLDIKPEPKPDFGSMTIDKVESENYLKNYQKNLQSNYNRYLKDRKEATEFWNEEVNILGKDPKDMPPMLRDLINDPNYKNFYLDLEPDTNTKHIAKGLTGDYAGTDINANLVDKDYLPKGGRALVTKDSGEGLFKKSADNFGDYKQVKPWEVFNKNFFIRKNKNGGWLNKYK